MSNPNYTRQLISDYCVLDTETTGLSAYYDEVIEIGILKVRNNNIVEKFSQLIKPEHEIDDFITDLTGITNDMVCDKPSILFYYIIKVYNHKIIVCLYQTMCLFLQSHLRQTILSNGLLHSL